MATIQGVYVALFGRPADPTGLTYFNTVTKNGADLKAIGDLASTQEYKDRFAGKSNLEIVSSIYQSLFNRTPDVAGLTFFVNALNNGTQNINTIAINILDGAQGSDKTTVDLKISAADAYTKALDTGAEIVAYSGNAAAAQGRAFIAGVTTTAPTQAAVDKAVADMVTASNNGGTGADGVTLTLTTGADLIAPNSTTDATKSTVGNDSIRALVKGALASADSIDGGAGTDTLSFVLDRLGGETIKPVLKNVEILNFNTDAASGNTLADTSTLDLSDSSGVQTIKASVGVIADGKTLTFKGIENATKITLDGAANAAGKVATVDVGFKTVSTSNDSATVVLNGVTKTGAVAGEGVLLKTAGIENLTLEVSKASVIGIADADAKVIKVTGSGDLTLSAVTGSDVSKVTSYDASGSTGAFTATIKGASVTGSKGVDKLTFTNGSVETAVYNSSNVSTLAAKDTITTFTTGEDKVDLKAFSFTGVKIDAFLDKAFAPSGDVAGFFKAVDNTQYAAAQNVNTIYVDVNHDGNFNAGTDLAFDANGIKIGDIIWS